MSHGATRFLRSLHEVGDAWEFAYDFEFSKRFEPRLKEIAGRVAVEVASPDDDRLRATDLIVQSTRPIRFACRTRSHEYLAKYPTEFTIRTGRISGVQTEAEKIMSGYGDYLIYGFENADGTDLAAWFVGDLNVFRRWVAEYETTYRTKPGVTHVNRDEASRFRSFDVRQLPPEFVVERREAA